MFDSGFLLVFGVQFCDFSRLVNERRIADSLIDPDQVTKAAVSVVVIF
jgi:hypothetical protein